MDSGTDGSIPWGSVSTCSHTLLHYGSSAPLPQVCVSLRFTRLLLSFTMNCGLRRWLYLSSFLCFTSPPSLMSAAISLSTHGKSLITCKKPHDLYTGIAHAHLQTILSNDLCLLFSVFKLYIYFFSFTANLLGVHEKAWESSCLTYPYCFVLWNATKLWMSFYIYR